MGRRGFLVTVALLAATAMATVLTLWTWPADANNCSGYPFTLTNGTTADATQVMANFNNILSCANANLAHQGVNTDLTQILNVTNLAFAGANSNITSLTGLTTPLAVSEGGTGSGTASGARTNLGLGTAAIENLLGNIIDDGAGNLKVGNSGVTAGTYTNPTITVAASGLLTSAANGAALPASATVTQQEGESVSNAYTSPATQRYSQSGVKAYIAWNYSGGVLNTITAFHASISRISAGKFTVSLTGGYIMAFGIATCSAFTGGNPVLISPIAGFSGTNPSQEVDVGPAGASDPDTIASCIIVGSTTN